jgi:hypothetical protein
MSTVQTQPSDRGVIYRPANLRLLHARLVAGDSPGEGSWCGPGEPAGWHPRELVWESNGDLSRLTLEAASPPGWSDSGDRPDPVCEGDAVRLVQPVADAPSVEWFSGHVAQTEIAIDPDAGRLRAVAYGPELRLKGVLVTGRWHKTPAADDAELQGVLSSDQAIRANAFRSDLPVIFNEGGLPNASGSDWSLSDAGETRACKVFEDPNRRVTDGDGSGVSAVHWTARTALRSLVEWFDDYETISPDTHWSGIERLLDETPIGEVRVEGRSLLGAIKAILLPAGFGFALEPWATDAGSAGAGRHRLRVFALRRPMRVRRPRLASCHRGPVSADSVEGRRAEVQQIRFRRDATRVRNEVTAIGAPRRMQVVLTFHDDALARDLHPVWDSSEHNLSAWEDASGAIDPWRWSQSAFETFDARYNRSGIDHAGFRHVFRSFAWNEDAGLAPLVTTAPDLSALGADGGFVRRARPVSSSLTFDSAGTRVRLQPRRVQLGLVGQDESWIDVPAEIWNHRAGFTLSADPLAGAGGGGKWYPYATCPHCPPEWRSLHYLTLLHNALRGDGSYRLRLRLIGSVECDDAAKAVWGADGSPWPFRAGKLVRLGRRAPWRQVADGLAPDTAESLVVDPHETAEACARQVGQACAPAAGRGHVVLRHLTRACEVGEGLGGTSGRQLDFALDASDEPRTAIITRVEWTFGPDEGKTRLVVESPIVR